MATMFALPPAPPFMGQRQIQLPQGPRDMMGLFRKPDGPAAPSVSLATSNTGTAALLHAYAAIGIDTESSRSLVMAAQSPPAQRPPMWDSETTSPALIQSLLAGLGDQFAYGANDDDGPLASIKAALRAAAATNNDPEATMALILSAWSTNSSSTTHVPPPPSGAPPPPPFEGELGRESGAEGYDAMDSMREQMRAMLDAEKAKAKEEAEAAVAPMAGYARASMTSRAAEKSARNAAADRAAAFLNPMEEFGEGAADGKVYFGGLPMGTSEGLVRVECMKFGHVTAVHVEANTGSLEGAWALVSFLTAEDAAAAVKRLGQRVALFGATSPVEVRPSTAEDEDRLAQAERARAEAAAAPAAQPQWPFQANEAAGGGARPRSRSRKRSRSRRRRDRDRRRRRSSSSRSASRGIKKPPPAAPVDRPVKTASGFDQSAPASGPGGGVLGNPGDPFEGGRQVGVRGNWAEFATPAGRNYYVNVITQEKTWARPADYNVLAATRAGGPPIAPNGLPTTGHSNLFVGSIPPGCNDIIFRQIFSPFGHIVSMKCVPEKNHGFVKFMSVHESQRAIDTMNGALINGTPLRVRFANMEAR